ncbi:MAG: DoxX family protein [Myxococcales bacterium]|nr:MAG: DoxX family protein [Myxococcales bacterium]
MTTDLLLASSLAADVPPSTRALWAGRILGALAVLFLAFDAIGKLLQVPQVVEGTTSLGYPASVIVPLGLLQLVCLALYLVPRTAVLGAILWTGYLGGAIATHVRVGNPLLSHTLFPVYVAAMLWGSLWLRDARLRALVPFQTTKGN